MAFLVRQGDYASALQIYSYVGNTDEVARVRISLRIEDLATKDVDVFGQKCFFFFLRSLRMEMSPRKTIKTAVI
jgi:hypothetical protein